MAYPTNLDFNPKSSMMMHIDLNSCFATVEQQANPLLRGRPVVIAAYTTPSGCILAPSIEAKEYGIKTGMRVKEGKLLYSRLIVLPPDPEKYRNVHVSLRKILRDYTNDFVPKSIDEFILNFDGYPILARNSMHQIGKQIKQRIKNEIGEWLTVSVGIAPNRFLAKLASNLRKPDGLDEINKNNYLKIYSKMSLTDLSGIKVRNAARLASVGIHNVVDFYNADIRTLKAAFNSVNGYYWYLRLRGWEIDDFKLGRKSYGNSYALPKPMISPEELSPILSKLVEKMGRRLRCADYKARGIHVSIVYRDWTHWHKGISFPKVLFDSRDIYKKAFKILCSAPDKKPVRELAISCFNLLKSDFSQLEFFEDVLKKENLIKAIDKINESWGNYVITSARMINAKEAVPDRIAFGGVKELEEFISRF
jgi:DNA polymerase-4